MDRYIIVKASRTINRPYVGPTCRAAGVAAGKVYTNLLEAYQDAERLTKMNPVGFRVVKLLNSGDNP